MEKGGDQGRETNKTEEKAEERTKMAVKRTTKRTDEIKRRTGKMGKEDLIPDNFLRLERRKTWYSLTEYLLLYKSK